MSSPRVVIVGGGSAGVTVAARLRRSGVPLRLTLVAPNDEHFYQPLWTLVGAGLARFSGDRAADRGGSPRRRGMGPPVAAALQHVAAEAIRLPWMYWHAMLRGLA